MFREREPHDLRGPVAAPVLIDRRRARLPMPARGDHAVGDAVRVAAATSSVHLYPAGHHANEVDEQVRHMELILDFFAEHGGPPSPDDQADPQRHQLMTRSTRTSTITDDALLDRGLAPRTAGTSRRAGFDRARTRSRRRACRPPLRRSPASAATSPRGTRRSRSRRRDRARCCGPSACRVSVANTSRSRSSTVRDRHDVRAAVG